MPSPPGHAYFSASTVEYRYVLYSPGKVVSKCGSGYMAPHRQRCRGSPAKSLRLIQWQAHPSVPPKLPPSPRAALPPLCMPLCAARSTYCSHLRLSKMPRVNYLHSTAFLSNPPPAAPAKTPDNRRAALSLWPVRSPPGRSQRIPAAAPRWHRSVVYRKHIPHSPPASYATASAVPDSARAVARQWTGPFRQNLPRNTAPYRPAWSQS